MDEVALTPAIEEAAHDIVVAIKFQAFGSLDHMEQLARERLPRLLATEMHRSVEPAAWAFSNGRYVESHNGTFTVVDLLMQRKEETQ